MFEYSHFSPTPRNSELATNRRRSAVEYFAAADSFEIVDSLGMNGKPEVCVARSSGEIVFPFPSGTLPGWQIFCDRIIQSDFVFLGHLSKQQRCEYLRHRSDFKNGIAIERVRVIQAAFTGRNDLATLR